MARVTRRKFLKASGASALAAKTSGMAGILAAGKAPAYAQATTVHWLKWNDFVPAGDQILRQSMLAEAEKALGARFDIRAFHDQLLGMGPLPLSVLDVEMRAWIAAQSARR